MNIQDTIGTITGMTTGAATYAIVQPPPTANALVQIMGILIPALASVITTYLMISKKTTNTDGSTTNK